MAVEDGRVGDPHHLFAVGSKRSAQSRRLSSSSSSRFPLGPFAERLNGCHEQQVTARLSDIGTVQSLGGRPKSGLMSNVSTCVQYVRNLLRGVAVQRIDQHERQLLAGFVPPCVVPGY